MALDGCLNSWQLLDPGGWASAAVYIATAVWAGPNDIGKSGPGPTSKVSTGLDPRWSVSLADPCTPISNT